MRVRVDAAVLDAAQLALGGDHETARRQLEELWRSLPSDDGFHRCIVAHYLADIQSEPRDELRWDRAALDAALACSPAVFEDRIPGVDYESFLPSLQLNLAASFERVGDLEAARAHARIACRSIRAPESTPLSRMTSSAILRLCDRLGITPD